MPSTDIAAFAGILHKRILTMSLIHKNDKGGGKDYNSPEIMVIDVATECGFATSTDKKYSVGIDPYEYEEDL